MQYFTISVQRTLDKQEAACYFKSLTNLKLISKLYQGLIEAFPDDTQQVKQKCEEDLGDAIDDNEWIEICYNSQSWRRL